MKFLLIIAIVTLGDPGVSVIEFDSMRACIAEKEDIRLLFKMEKVAGTPHMFCVSKANG